MLLLIDKLYGKFKIKQYYSKINCCRFLSLSNYKNVNKIISINKLYNEINELHSNYSSNSILSEISQLQLQLHDNKSWKSSNGNDVNKRLLYLTNRLNEITALKQKLIDTIDLHNIAIDLLEDDTINECNSQYNELSKLLHEIKINDLFVDSNDEINCYIQINAGAGGKESGEWVRMLFNMYNQWCNYSNRNYNIDIIDETIDHSSNVLLLRSITAKVSGYRAYGWMKAEAGVHRLVRISPFDPQSKRHTTFAQVLIFPDIVGFSNDIKVNIDPSDIKIETKKSSGAGGQHVNTTDSAVRITHIPTGIVVSCQKERSQHRNKSIALEMLTSKLYLHFKEINNNLKDQLVIGSGDNSWGNQIRSLTLQPYTLVKDHRCGWESGNTNAYLNGELLDECMESVLIHKAKAIDE